MLPGGWRTALVRLDKYELDHAMLKAHLQFYGGPTQDRPNMGRER
jgi:hypothetical protein